MIQEPKVVCTVSMQIVFYRVNNTYKAEYTKQEKLQETAALCYFVSATQFIQMD